MSKRFFTNPGSPVVPIREPCVSDDGIVQVVTVGYENVQDKIQSFVNQTLIPNIIARFTAGDTSALSVNTPMFGDFTQMPKTYAEFLQKMIDGEKLFAKLPKEVKEKFGNSYQKFLASSTDDDFLVKAGFVKEPILSDAAKPVGDGVVSEITNPIKKEVI